MGWGALAGLGNAMNAAGTGLIGLGNTSREDAKDAYKEEAQRLMEERIHERTRVEKEADRGGAKDDAKELALFNKGLQNDDPLKDLQVKKAQIELSAAEAETKLPPAVKLEFDALKKDSELISTQIYKAQSDGTYDATSATEMMKQIENNRKRMSALLTPYQGDKVPKPGSGVDLSTFDKSKNTKTVGSTGSWE